eukprot:g10620.t1
MWEWCHDRYMGAAHGVMGILFMLLHVPELLEGESLDLLRQSLQWLATMRQPSGNWPVVFGEGGADCIHFCHGAPGAVFLFCKAYEVLREEQWLQLAKDRALSVDPCNTRALFRRGCAYSNAQGWLLARKDFEQVLRLEPNNEAARRELEKLEAELPPAAPDVLARTQEDLPVATVPKDPAAAVRMAQKEAERFRREILAMADKKDWTQVLNPNFGFTRPKGVF